MKRIFNNAEIRDFYYEAVQSQYTEPDRPAQDITKAVEICMPADDVTYTRAPMIELCQ